MLKKDLVIIGAGPAGLAAVLSAYNHGIRDILILERESFLGGILNQCIHNGFGLHIFKAELTGPEYAARYIEKIHEAGIEYWLDTMVIDLSKTRKITAMNETRGVIEIQAKAVVLAMGCRERTRGALNIPGFRPSGIFSAGTAQKYVNIDGYLPGREIVILGSGDIGLIMARRLTLEGAKVKMVLEIMPYSGGLKRNIVQCLDDYGIPLKLSHTIVNIHGKDRITGITYAKVDKNLEVIAGTEEYVSCDTLLLSVGLIPENELSRKAGVSINKMTQGPLVANNLETSVPGVYACGNVLHVHDLVDYVSEEAEEAGKSAALHILAKDRHDGMIKVQAGRGIRYTVPSAIDPEAIDKFVIIRFRVDNVYERASLMVRFDNDLVSNKEKRILTPGEMEQVILPKAWFTSRKDAESIIIEVGKE